MANLILLQKYITRTAKKEDKDYHFTFPRPCCRFQNMQCEKIENNKKIQQDKNSANFSSDYLTHPLHLFKKPGAKRSHIRELLFLYKIKLNVSQHYLNNRS